MPRRPNPAPRRCQCGDPMQVVGWVVPVDPADPRLLPDDRYIDGDPLRPRPSPTIRGRGWAVELADVSRYWVGRPTEHDLLTDADALLSVGACRNPLQENTYDRP